jgi:hypothetical protein
MNSNRVIQRSFVLPLLAATLLLALPNAALAHCDALDGPVVTDARTALETGRVDPVLKWVSAADEAEIRDAFARTLRVRTASAEAAQLADRYFFETVVRLHRAFEGEPYTGLKPAGTDAGPGVRAADAALASGSLQDLRAMLLRDVEQGLAERFEMLLRAREHADHSVDAGRAYVHAYVEFVHYAKRLHESANSSAAHGAAPAGHAHHAPHHDGSAH